MKKMKTKIIPGKSLLNFSNKNTNVNLVIMFFAITGIICLYHLTRFGAGLSHDSIYYLVGAKSLLSGQGYLNIYGNPMTHWPPMYSMLIAAANYSGLGGDTAESARIVNLFMFFIAIVTFGKILKKITNNDLIVILIGLFIFTSSYDMFLIFRMALSDPTFIALALLSFYTLYLYLEKKKTYMLLLTGLLAGFTFIDRHIGVTIIFSCIVIVFLSVKRNIKLRIHKTLTFLIIAIIPVASWLIRNSLVKSHSAAQLSDFAFLNTEDAKNLFHTVSNWFIPTLGIPETVRYISGAVFLLLIFMLTVKYVVLIFKQKTQFTDSAFVLFIFCWVYFLTLVISEMLSLTKSAFLYRMMSPLYPFVLLMALNYLHRKIRFSVIRTAKQIILFSVIAVFLVLHISRLVNFISRQNDGYGYASSKWKNSEAILICHEYGKKVSYVSNLPVAVHYLADVHCESYYKTKFEKDIEKPVLLILFKGISSRPFKKPDNGSAFHLMKETDDAYIYKLNK